MSAFTEVYDQLQREAQLQDGCRKIVSGVNGWTMKGFHICGKPRVNGEYCERHRYGV